MMQRTADINNDFNSVDLTWLQEWNWMKTQTLLSTLMATVLAVHVTWCYFPNFWRTGENILWTWPCRALIRSNSQTWSWALISLHDASASYAPNCAIGSRKAPYGSLAFITWNQSCTTLHWIKCWQRLQPDLQSLSSSTLWVHGKVC